MGHSEIQVNLFLYSKRLLTFPSPYTDHREIFQRENNTSSFSLQRWPKLQVSNNIKQKPFILEKNWRREEDLGFRAFESLSPLLISVHKTH